MENPKIRFKGFTKDWEQRKLGDDLVSIHTGTNLLGSITNTGMPLIKMGNIQRGYFDTSKVEFLAENEQPDKADIVNYGDFFFNTRNTLELVGKGATWMKNSGEYAFNSNIARFELRNLDTIFFNYLYNTDYMTKQIHARAMGTTSVAAIYPRTLDSVEYLAPCMKEQQKIGAYFKQLDHLITLHQRKCEQTKKMKKYMLQKMFPQNGAKVPEIRFDGFTYDWEQRKFSELYARSSEKNDGSIGMDKNITVATMQFKNDVKVSTTEYLKTYYTFKLGDIAFEGHQSKEFRYGRFVENDIGNGIVSHIFAVFRPIQEYDLYFWKYAINNETLMQRILARSTKASTMMHDLVTNDFLNETFLVPSVKEQKQIGAFLNKLDNLITLHQRQTDFYKKISFYYISS